MIGAGVFDKRIQIYKPIAQEDGQGGYNTALSLVMKVWAEFKKPRFSSSIAEGTPVTVITQGIKIRQNSKIADIRRGWQVVYNNAEFIVLHVDYSVRGELLLTCKEVEK